MAKARFVPLPPAAGESDGTFYYQIAQSVAAGEGLRTRVSLYFQGLRELPAPTNVQPLWPLVLGLSGRCIGLARAAQTLPVSLFLLDLVLLWALGNALARSFGAEALVRVRGVPVLDAGTLLALLFGCNWNFFLYTSSAWTEGLAFALLVGSLLALAPPARGRSPVPWAALAGALAGLAYLTRSQFLGLPFAIAAALAGVGTHSRAHRRAALAALGAAALVVAPWVAWVASWAHALGWRMWVDFTAYRETPGLPVFRGFVEARGLAAQLAQLAEGFTHAFHPWARESYAESFGAAALLPLVALLFAAWRRVGRGPRAHAPREAPWVTRPGSLLALAALLAGAVALAPVHTMRTRFPYEWSFGWRHGLPFVLWVATALSYLAARGRVARAIVLGAAAVALAFPMRELPRFRGLTWATGPRMALVRWLRSREGTPVVLSTHSRQLAAWAGVGTRWARCDLSAADTRSLLAHVHVDYVAVFPGDADCPFLDGVVQELEPVRRFGEGRGAIALLRVPLPVPGA